MPIGAERDFILKHHSLIRPKSIGKVKTEDGKSYPLGENEHGIVKITVKSGSLLVMKYPTNIFWYHSLPKRAKIKDVRISLTFRGMKVGGNGKE